VDRVGRWSGEQWKEISPYLDQVLDLEESERARWLNALSALRPRLADDLRVLLATHEAIDAARFLERSPLSQADEPVAGQRYGAYLLESLLGRSAMGSTWLARNGNGSVDPQVVLRFLDHRGVGLEGAAHIRREAGLRARQAHPSSAQLLEAGFGEHGQPFLILEYFAGTPIDEYCRKRAMPPAERLALFAPIADAVADAHTRGIVHQSIKPSNVLVTVEGKAKLLDLWIASLIADSTALSTSASLAKTASLGKTAPFEAAPEGQALDITPAFAAPELIRGERATPASDVYSLGILLHVLIADRHPFAADTSKELIRAVLTEDPGLTSESVLSASSKIWLKGDLDAVIAKAIKREPENRYFTAGELAADIRRFLSHLPVHARRHTLMERASLFVRRRFGLPAV
jgi:eukaryotic-like serine/threonine-protein kinase